MPDISPEYASVKLYGTAGEKFGPTAFTQRASTLLPVPLPIDFENPEQWQFTRLTSRDICAEVAIAGGYFWSRGKLKPTGGGCYYGSVICNATHRDGKHEPNQLDRLIQMVRTARAGRPVAIYKVPRLAFKQGSQTKSMENTYVVMQPNGVGAYPTPCIVEVFAQQFVGNRRRWVLVAADEEPVGRALTTWSDQDIQIGAILNKLAAQSEENRKLLEAAEVTVNFHLPSFVSSSVVSRTIWSESGQYPRTYFR